MANKQAVAVIVFEDYGIVVSSPHFSSRRNLPYDLADLQDHGVSFDEIADRILKAKNRLEFHIVVDKDKIHFQRCNRFIARFDLHFDSKCTFPSGSFIRVSVGGKRYDFDCHPENEEQVLVGTVVMNAVGKPIKADMKPNEKKIVASQKSSAGEEAARLRQQGNEFFNQGNHEKAVEIYTKSLETEFSTLTLSNRAQANLQLGKYAEAHSDAGKVLEVEPDNVKALARRAKATMGIAGSQLDGPMLAEAKRDLQRAVELEPTNAKVRELLEELKATPLKSGEMETEDSEPFLPPAVKEENPENPELAELEYHLLVLQGALQKLQRDVIAKNNKVMFNEGDVSRYKMEIPCLANWVDNAKKEIIETGLKIKVLSRKQKTNKPKDKSGAFTMESVNTLPSSSAQNVQDQSSTLEANQKHKERNLRTCSFGIIDCDTYQVYPFGYRFSD